MSEKYPGGFVTYNPPTPSQTSATGIWTLSQQEQYQQAGLWPNAPMQISRSLRFNSADSAYLNRTPASASNRTTWTWSGWVKRSSFGTDQQLFSAGGSGAFQFLYQTSTDCLYIYDSVSSTTAVITTQVFRDPSAWYHVVLATDTTQATASNRFKLYINGSQVTSFGTATYPAQNSTLSVNNTVNHSVGSWSGAGGGNFFSGYMTEVNFIDGQALTPSSFGYTNPDTGVWSPKPYLGTYGTNGFHLTFSDNSNTTATTLGADSSGNGNNWTPNNFSVTAGAGNDSLVDSPTSYGTDTGVGGTVRGNYAILNPLTILPTGQALSITNGNLDYSGTTGWWGARSSIGMTSGKWYCEVTITGGSTPYNTVVGLTTSQAAASGIDFYPGLDAYGWGYFGSNGRKFNNGTSTAYGNNFGINVTVGIAFDADAGSLTFYESGTSQGVAFTGLTNGPYFFTFGEVGASGSFNFGQRPFVYTAPSGYKALCTQNLPTPTIGATSTTLATQYFNPVTYAGTGATQSVTVGFQPDWVWIKNRTNGANWHVLTDAVRGVQKEIYTNSTAAEATLTTTGVNQFNSSGFQILGSSGDYNRSGDNYVAWNWKANGSGSTNTSGYITSTVSANTTSGFSIVTYTGNGTGTSSNGTVGHGLGVVPSMIIIKRRDNTGFWYVATKDGGTNSSPTYSVFTRGSSGLNQTGAAFATGQTYASSGYITSSTFNLYWLNAAVTAGDSYDINYNTGTYVAYCFAEVAGYSKFGSYTGNGSTTDGVFIYTGFRPKYIMFKGSSAVTNWSIFDTSRNPYNLSTQILAANDSLAEFTTTDSQIDILSNGIKIRSTATASGINQSGATYIFAAFAETPLKYSLAR